MNTVINSHKITNLEALGCSLISNSNIKDYTMIDKYDVVIFEGYEMTGKTSLLNELSQTFDNYVVDFRPSYETLNYSYIIDRPDRYIHGLHLFDFYRQNKLKGKLLPKLFLDRNIHTGIAYGLGLQGKDISYYSQAIQNTKMATEGLKVLVIYKYHKDEVSARRMFELANKDDSRILDKYDDTEFNTYWSNYKKFDNLFQQAFSELKFDIIGISSFCEDYAIINDRYNIPSNYFMRKAN